MLQLELRPRRGVWKFPELDSGHGMSVCALYKRLVRLVFTSFKAFSEGFAEPYGGDYFRFGKREAHNHQMPASVRPHRSPVQLELLLKPSVEAMHLPVAHGE